MVNEIAESYPLARSRPPQNLKFEESRPKAVGGLFSLPNFTFKTDLFSKLIIHLIKKACPLWAGF